MIKKCAECREEIAWDDNIFVGEDGEAYHAECVTAYPTGYSLFGLSGDYITQSEDMEDMAICLLDHGEYVDDEEDV